MLNKRQAPRLWLKTFRIIRTTIRSTFRTMAKAQSLGSPATAMPLARRAGPEATGLRWQRHPVNRTYLRPPLRIIWWYMGRLSMAPGIAGQLRQVEPRPASGRWRVHLARAAHHHRDPRRAGRHHGLRRGRDEPGHRGHRLPGRLQDRRDRPGGATKARGAALPAPSASSSVCGSRSSRRNPTAT